MLEEDKNTVRNQFSVAGDILFRLLDTWQNSGASFMDLCDLCGKDHDKVMREIPADVLDMTFGDIMFITYLDYPADGKDFIQLETDAPFTQAIREYMTDRIMHDPVGHHATDKAFQECFPGIMENSTHMYTDEDYLKRRNLFELF